MSVVTRGALEDSPLADLHELAGELSIDGFRRLRREDLINAILERQGAEVGEDTSAPVDEEAEEKPARRRRTRRPAKSEEGDGEGPRAAEASAEDEPGGEGTRTPASAVPAADEDDEEDRPSRRRRARRGGRGRAESVDGDTPGADEPADAEPAREADETVDGVVELLPNGSGFVRVSPPDPSDADVYISAAQVKRCELVSGDHVSGPRRAPRRSERFASLVRVDTVNGRPADEISEGVRFEELPAAFPRERIALRSEDPTLKAIEFLAPFGRGSRVSIVGGPRAGKSEALRRIHAALEAHEDFQVSLVLAGARPEEIFEAAASSRPAAASAPLGVSPDAQAATVELAVDQARRMVARGAHAVVLIDTLDGLVPHVARRIIASARNIVDGGSLTIIATSSAPVGGETTVIALDPGLTAQGRFPALDLAAGGTLRPELLIGEEAAAAIARARAEAIG